MHRFEAGAFKGKVPPAGVLGLGERQVLVTGVIGSGHYLHRFYKRGVRLVFNREPRPIRFLRRSVGWLL
jgi:hypothetical protein